MATSFGNLTPGEQQRLAQMQSLYAAQSMQNLLGAFSGRYWQASQAVQGNPFNSPNSGNNGAQAAAYFAASNAAAAPEPIEDAGIRAGEVIAWRCWRIQGGYLRSGFVERIWAPGEPMEGDTKSHGVHAWKSLSFALEYGLHGKPDHECVVIGQVELWGDIVEHERGYRAEFAAIKSLDGALDGYPDALAGLRKLYGVGGRDDLTPNWAVPPQRTNYEEVRELTLANAQRMLAAAHSKPIVLGLNPISQGLLAFAVLVGIGLGLIAFFNLVLSVVS